MRDADSPAANAPHFIRQFEFHHILTDACQVVLQITVLLTGFGPKPTINAMFLQIVTNHPFYFVICSSLTLSESCWLWMEPSLLLTSSSLDKSPWMAMILITSSRSIFFIFFFLALLVFILSLSLDHPSFNLRPENHNSHRIQAG